MFSRNALVCLQIMKRITSTDRAESAFTAPKVSSLGLAKRVKATDSKIEPSPTSSQDSAPPCSQQDSCADLKETTEATGGSSAAEKGANFQNSQSQPLKPGPLLAASIKKGKISIGSKTIKPPRGSGVAKHSLSLAVKKNKHKKAKKDRSQSRHTGVEDAALDEESTVLASFGKRHFLHIEKEEEYSMTSLPLDDKGQFLWLNQETMLPRQRTVMDYSKYETDIGTRMCLIVPAYEEFMMR